jgi:CheY-like chemotaxis protein
VGLLVLLVDDNRSSRRALRDAIEAEDIDTVAPKTGARALELLDKYAFDAIVTDILMPVVDGFDILARARDAHPSTPVVAVTGLLDESVEDAGFDEWLPKPVDAKILAALLRRLAKERMQ